MTTLHEVVLYGILGFVGLSLVIPGLLEMVGTRAVANPLLEAKSAAAKSHLRSLNAMMAAVGAVAFWACWNLQDSRRLVLVLGLVFALVAAARGYSLIVDGRPDRKTILYLGVEIILAVILLSWPPPG
jgi:hypothetical protein